MTALAARVGATELQNPVLLAAGTAAYGRALDGVVRLDALGGIVTKAVSIAPRAGNRGPRVAEFPGGMINAVGLANPGVDTVLQRELPWLAAHVTRARVVVNVVGDTIDEFGEVVARLEAAPNVAAYELNVSCPNVKAGGAEFGSDRASLSAVVATARRATSRPIWVKLSPVHPRLGEAAVTARDAGADAVTVVNTIPGLVVDVEKRRPRVGFGSGGVSGSAILPAGVLATWRVREASGLPVVGVGGIDSAYDALQYIIAGASAVEVGTAAMRDPRAPERIVRDLERWCRAHGVSRIGDLVGTLEWPA